MLLHTLLFFPWPVSVFKTIERWIQNFIWEEDIDKRKLVIVAWHKCYQPFAEGGLGIRSLLFLNDASNLKLCWDMLNLKDQWAAIIRQSVMRGGRHINYIIFYSLWSTMKGSFADVKDDSTWILGNGKNIHFWLDKWEGSVAVNNSDFNFHKQDFLNDRVAEYISNCKWSFPQCITTRFPSIYNLL
ncbi:unnamed protein product [Lathyrus sativus]|nr:unnamed protein product [Lathyrus sativus]